MAKTIAIVDSLCEEEAVTAYSRYVDKADPFDIPRKNSVLTDFFAVDWKTAPPVALLASPGAFVPAIGNHSPVEKTIAYQ